MEDAGTSVEVEPAPLEVRPPPLPVLAPTEEPWLSLHEEMGALARELDVTLRTPGFIPWSRKAHELTLHAQEKGCFRPIHRALFEAHFVEGKDIGRVDVLVEIGSGHGLDRTEIKTVLDVDRFKDAVLEIQGQARQAEVVGVPTLLGPGRRLEGFQGPEAVHAFIDAIRSDAR